MAEQAKVTIQRIEHHTGNAFDMTIGLDGNDVCTLPNGRRATISVQPGKHTISGRLGFWPIKVSGEIAFDIEPGQHLNFTANPAGGTWGNKLVFQRSGHEGEIQFG